MNKPRKKPSNGKAGEKAAEWWFRQNGWVMFRTQPETRTIYITVIKFGKQVKMPVQILVKDSGGIADFTGYKHQTGGCMVACPLYKACEVKEADDNKMPYSRIEPDQRDWLEKLPEECRYVGIFWRDHNEFKMYKYVCRSAGRGSYKY